MRVKEGWTGVSGVGAWGGADVTLILEAELETGTDGALGFAAGRTGRLLRDEEDDVDGVGVGVDDWEEADEEAEEEREVDSVDMYKCERVYSVRVGGKKEGQKIRRAFIR